MLEYAYMKPTYYKALWHNCMKCRLHFMSEAPHLKAYLCDECWNSMPHYSMTQVTPQQPDKGPTHNWVHLIRSLTFSDILLYIIGNGLCILIVVYYLWFK